MKGLSLYCSLQLPYQVFMAGMDSEVHGMVMDDLATGTAADPGMDLAVVPGMDLVGAHGMADHGGKIAKMKKLSVRQGVSSFNYRNFFYYIKKLKFRIAKYIQNL